jgi:hypothetical protein
MNAEISEAFAIASTTIKIKNTFVGGEDWYGVRHLLPPEKWRKRRKMFSAYDVFAEDECGNEFLLDGKHRVFFWEHETNNLKQISDSILNFLSGLSPTPEVNLKPGQVKHAWINPEFKAKLDQAKE